MNITENLLLQIGFKEDGFDPKAKKVYSLQQSHHPKISVIEYDNFWRLSIDDGIVMDKHTTFKTLFFSLYIWGYEDGKDDKRREIWKALGL